jgi:hypothetical protein
MNTTGEDSEKKTVGWTDGAQDEGVGSFDDYLRQDREVLESRLVAPDKLTPRKSIASDDPMVPEKTNRWF